MPLRLRSPRQQYNDFGQGEVLLTNGGETMIVSLRQRLDELRRGFDSLREAERRPRSIGASCIPSKHRNPSIEDAALHRGVTGNKAATSTIRRRRSASRPQRNNNRSSIITSQPHICGFRPCASVKAHCPSCSGYISTMHCRYLKSLEQLPV